MTLLQQLQFMYAVCVFELCAMALFGGLAWWLLRDWRKLVGENAELKARRR